MIQNLITFLHGLLCFAIVALVLLQRGKGADAGAGFGAGASGTVFGARGAASFLTRATAVLATVFFATSLGLAYLAGDAPAPTSLMDQGMQTPSPGAGIEPAPGDFNEPVLPDIGVTVPPPVDESAAGEGATE